MAELEAITTVGPKGDDRAKATSAKTERFGRRLPLPLNRPTTLGRAAETADLVVPDDPMISGSSAHVTLTWDGTKLTVAEKDKPHKNRIRVNGVVVPPDAPPVRCEVPLGGVFEVGQTTFTLYADGDGVPAGPADGTLAWTAPTDPRPGAADAPFANPPVVLAALAELSQGLRTKPNEQARVKHMLMVTVAALPRADAAGLVFVPPDATPAQPKIGIREHFARLAGRGVNPAGPGAAKPPFAPSRRLVHQAITGRKSLLYVWQTGGAAAPPMAGSAGEPTLQPPSAAGAAAWAVCAPLQQGTGMALYVSGYLHPGEAPGQRAVADELAGYQKVVELMAGLLEITRQTYRLTEEKARFWPFVPKPIREVLADPDRAAGVMNARETEVVVLFCDLRNFTKYLVQQNKPLEDRWREVAFHLNMMSTAVTVNGGVVCRVLGDAIMGFWGWPDAAGPDPDRLGAARAAGQIQSGIGWFRQLQCGVGVACGRALVGKLGTEHLAEIDLYGPVVNLAARLEAMTKAFGVGVVVTDEVADRLRREPGPARTRRLGRVRPKGMEGQPCEVHELLAEGPQGGHDWSEWDGLVEAFTAGGWAEAGDKLEAFYSDDPAAQCLLRVMNRHGRRPPAGWDGAFVPAPPADGGGESDTALS